MGIFPLDPRWINVHRGLPWSEILQFQPLPVVRVFLQNGVQIAFGAHGKVTGNTITDHYYTPPDWVACGILSIYGGGAIGQTKTNTFAGNEVNVCTAGNGPSSNSPFNPESG